MMLLTQEIKRKLPPIGATDKLGNRAPIVVKFFNPVGSATWWITEGEEEEGDWRLFGFADLYSGGDSDTRSPEAELGYVMLSELQSVKLAFGLSIERDRHYGFGHTLAEVIR